MSSEDSGLFPGSEYRAVVRSAHLRPVAGVCYPSYLTPQNASSNITGFLPANTVTFVNDHWAYRPNSVPNLSGLQYPRTYRLASSHPAHAVLAEHACAILPDSSAPVFRAALQSDNLSADTITGFPPATLAISFRK